MASLFDSKDDIFCDEYYLLHRIGGDEPVDNNSLRYIDLFHPDNIYSELISILTAKYRMDLRSPISIPLPVHRWKSLVRVNQQMDDLISHGFSFAIVYKQRKYSIQSWYLAGEFQKAGYESCNTHYEQYDQLVTSTHKTNVHLELDRSYNICMIDDFLYDLTLASNIYCVFGDVDEAIIFTDRANYMESRYGLDL